MLQNWSYRRCDQCLSKISADFSSYIKSPVFNGSVTEALTQCQFEISFLLTNNIRVLLLGMPESD